MSYFFPTLMVFVLVPLGFTVEVPVLVPVLVLVGFAVLLLLVV